MKSNGLLNPPFLFMYCLYFLFWDTLMAYAFAAPSTFLPLVVSKEAKPIIFIISISSSVLPCKSSSVICRSLPLVSLLSFFSSSRLSFSRRGEEELERCLRGDLDRRRCGERERVLLLSLSRDRVRSLRLLSRSREADRERRRSRRGGERDRLRPIAPMCICPNY